MSALTLVSEQHGAEYLARWRFAAFGDGMHEIAHCLHHRREAGMVFLDESAWLHGSL